jgi:hypothetical protein
MATFDFKTYMAECAIKLKSIGHTTQSPKFFVVSSIANLESLLANLTTGASFPAIVIHDSQEGHFGDQLQSQNFIDHSDYTFYVIDKVTKINDIDHMEEVKRNCKAYGFQIIGRMLKHKKEALRSPAGNDPYGLQLFEKRNIAYQTIGPIGNNCFGVMFFITVPSVADVTYDNDDWSE